MLNTQIRKISGGIGKSFYGGCVRGKLLHHHLLWWWERHLPTFLGVGYICCECFHCSSCASHCRCKFRCKFCGGRGKCEWEGISELCQACKVVYPNTSYASGHLLRGMCDGRATCLMHGKWYFKKLANRGESLHKCRYNYCTMCHAMMPSVPKRSSNCSPPHLTTCLLRETRGLHYRLRTH